MSVEKRRKGGHTVYLARWREGTRQRARTFTRKADAEGFERERRREAALGAHGLPEPSPMSLEDWLRRWWDAEAAGWAPSTRRTQASSIDLWIEPYVGGVRLRDLGHARVWRAPERVAIGPPQRPPSAGAARRARKAWARLDAPPPDLSAAPPAAAPRSTPPPSPPSWRCTASARTPWPRSGGWPRCRRTSGAHQPAPRLRALADAGLCLAELDQVIRDKGHAPASSPQVAMHRARLDRPRKGARAVLRQLRSGSRPWRLGIRAREPVAGAA